MRSFSYLASGPVSQDVRDPSHTYTFAANDNGRNASASLNSSTVGSYLYNAFEQRVQKAAGGVTTQFVFDRFGHLLEEADASGTVQREYIWLDDLPVAMVDDTGLAPVIYYIHTDQLGTPQKITDQAARLVWDGQFDPFGNIIPISITPISGGTNWGTGVWNSFNWDLPPLAAVPTNLRFPGQYADAETGLSRNWNRDYDPTMGRYVQSDPAGVWAKPNSYGYAAQNPLSVIDPSGRFYILGYQIATYGNWCGPDWTGGYSKSWNELSAKERKHVKSRLISWMINAEGMTCVMGIVGSIIHAPQKRHHFVLGFVTALHNGAYAFGGFWGDAIGYVMGRPGTRSPGPNKRACCSTKE